MLNINYLFSPLRNTKIIFHWYYKKQNLLLRCQLAGGELLVWVVFHHLFFLGICCRFGVFPCYFLWYYHYFPLFDLLIIIIMNNCLYLNPGVLTTLRFQFSLASKWVREWANAYMVLICLCGLNHDICNNLGYHSENAINCNYEPWQGTEIPFGSTNYIYIWGLFTF